MVYYNPENQSRTVNFYTKYEGYWHLEVYYLIYTSSELIFINLMMSILLFVITAQ
jgi:hypothetical protein